MSLSFSIPKINYDANSWGPTTIPDEYLGLDYVSIHKSEKLGKIADFVGKKRNDVLPEGEESFTLVDNIATQRPKRNTLIRKKVYRTNYNYNDNNNNNYRRNDNKNWYRRRDYQTSFEPSIKAKAEWKVVTQFQLSDLTKLSAEVPEVEDIAMAGELNYYNDQLDSLNTKKPTNLNKCPDKIFYYANAFDDQVMATLAQQNAGNIYTTDDVVAQLVSCSRSIYPWDILVRKVNGKLFFYKRDNSINMKTVNETTRDPPNPEEKDTELLINEATTVNQYFSQHILNPSEKKKLQYPNPFYDEDEDEDDEEENSENNKVKRTPAPVGYRYRKFHLNDDCMLIMRTQIDGICKKNNKEQYYTTCTLNEWKLDVPKQDSWRNRLDNNRVAVLAFEMKQNSFRVAKSICQAIFSGSDQMKFGFVSRRATSDRLNHVILGIQSGATKTFADQMNLNLSNMWGVLKGFIQLFDNVEDGKYIIVRDPNKPFVRIYSIPLSEFEDEEEDDDEEDEDDDEEDENDENDEEDDDEEKDEE